MKADRRHELKENALSSELLTLWGFLKRHGNLIAWVALGAAIVVLLIVWSVRSSRAADERLRDQYYELTLRAETDESVLNGLRELSDNKKNPQIAALAAVGVGDRLSLLAAINPAQRQAMIREAADYYDKAIRSAGDQAYIVAKAHFGLAKLNETAGDFEAAKRHYQAAIGAVPVGDPVRKQAEDGLAKLDNLRTPVLMAATAPATEPDTQPATQAATTPATGPATATASPSATRPASLPDVGG
jgi:tetratricopeptide (TPR) repeat protein